jgi:hypothetical protein
MMISIHGLSIWAQLWNLLSCILLQPYGLLRSV